jgi:RNA polymerase sigma-B factor
MSQLTAPTSVIGAPVDLRSREELIQDYEALALSIARRRCHRVNEREDVEQVARMALIKAADRFDPYKGVSFATFAWSTIEGEIKRYFRDCSSSVHVNRALRESSLRVSVVADELTNTLGRAPTIQELAEDAGLSVERVIEALELLRTSRPMSLDGMHGEEEEGFEISVVDHEMDVADDRGFLLGLTKHLSARERRILALRFFEQRSQLEIGNELGISQMHVSRLLNRSLTKLRELARSQ